MFPKTYIVHVSHFNPLPPHGGRPVLFPHLVRRSTHFNPLPPHGGRRRTARNAAYCQEFQSTPSAWRETQAAEKRGTRKNISIHSLRMEGDRISCNSRCTSQISIHSLRMEGDPVFPDPIINHFHFNPLPPHGGRPRQRRCKKRQLKFQSTPSAWRET